MPVARQSASVVNKLNKIISGGGDNYAAPQRWANAMYGSGWPIQPVEAPKDVELPREIDFPIAVNTTLVPRVGYGLMPFAALLEAYENVPEASAPVRLITRELTGFLPHLVDVEGNTIEDHPYAWMTEYPDRKTPFGVWMTRFLKSSKIYDAPAVYMERGKEGIEALHYIDGSTLFLIVDQFGNVPSPEPVEQYVRRGIQNGISSSSQLASGGTGSKTLVEFATNYINRQKAGLSVPTKIPAYTQVIKGTPFSWWSSDDIWYMPQSRRVNAPYGESFIELAWSWIMIIVNITAFELGHYRTGNMPEGFITVPKDWFGTADTVMAAEQMYNQRMTSNPTTERNRVRLFPDGTKYFPTKKPDFPRDLYSQAKSNILDQIGVLPSEFGDIPGGGLGGKGFKEGAAADTGRHTINPNRDFLASIFNFVLKRDGVTDVKFSLDYPNEEIDPDKQRQAVFEGMAHGTMSLNEALGQLNMNPVGDPKDPENIANKHLIVAGSTIFVIEDMETANGMAIPSFSPVQGGSAGGAPVGPESVVEDEGKEHTPQDMKTLQEAIQNIQQRGTLDSKMISVPSGKKLTKGILLFQKDVDYGPRSTLPDQFCGNCRWFSKEINQQPCYLVINAPMVIVPEGHCQRWEVTPDNSYVQVENPLDYSVNNPNLVPEAVPPEAQEDQVALGAWPSWMATMPDPEDDDSEPIGIEIGGFATKLAKMSGLDPADDDYYAAPISRHHPFEFPQGGHANGVDIVAVTPDGLQPKAALWKPQGGEMTGLQNYIGGEQYKREEAAYLLDRSLGFYLVPVAFVTESDGEYGTAVLYSLGATAGKYAGDYGDEWQERAAVLDYIAGQQDRGTEGHNYFTHAEDETRPVLFDNGLTFPVNAGAGYQTDIYHAGDSSRSGFCDAWRDKPLSEATLIALTVCRGDASAWSDIKALVGEQAANNAMARLQRLLDEQTIPAPDLPEDTDGSWGL